MARVAGRAAKHERVVEDGDLDPIPLGAWMEIEHVGLAIPVNRDGA